MKKHILQNLIILLLVFGFWSCLKSSKSTNQELFIIGTMHFPSDGINADSIFNVLKKLKPQVILMELDSSAFNKNFKLKINLDENEYNAVVNYLKENPQVKIRPIEFEGRDKYRKSIGITPNPGKTFDILSELNKSNRLNEKEKLIWDNFMDYYSNTAQLAKGNLKGLNLSNTDRLIDSLMLYQYIKVKRIVDVRHEFKKLMLDAKGDSVSIKDHFQDWANFEYNLRNKQMTENTISVIKSFPDKKRFVLLVGFQHRFYIKKELKKRNPNIEIKEYYN